jgi:hypothetical protein
VADWDSISYTSATPHCPAPPRRHQGVPDRHRRRGPRDGEIWSRALWDIHTALGDTKASTLIVEAQFAFTVDITFHDAALATVAAASRLYGNQAANAARQAFQARGIL